MKINTGVYGLCMIAVALMRLILGVVHNNVDATNLLIAELF